MRHFVLFVVGLALIGKAAGDGYLPMLDNGNSCRRFGMNFCTGALCEVWRDEDAFTCKCNSEDAYFDAVTKTCEFRKSCKTTECALGQCKQTSSKSAKCVCVNVPDVTLYCKADEYFTRSCAKKGGKAVVRKDWTTTAVCDCGEWAVMNRTGDNTKDKCVPTTCLHPAITCKHLCESNLLGKDTRCCEGWDSRDCSQTPKEGTYCPPGSIKQSGVCKDACTAGEGNLLCDKGCTRSQDPKRSYQCKCGQGEEVAEDGITCRRSKVRGCNDEEKKKCRADQVCDVRADSVACKCAEHEHEVGGVCTGDCTENNCHEDFMDCRVHYGRQDCSCPWKRRKPRASSGKCELNEYYYTVSFKSNISLGAENCAAHEKKVLDAIRTTLGPQIYKAEVLNCKDNITARLITQTPLSKYLLKMLQTCKFPDGDFCIFYPLLPIEKGSATVIKEENLCESLLKAQESAYKGANKCVKDGDLFWFKCESGYREVDRKTIGRLRRSVCEPGISCDPEDELRCHKDGHICIYQDGKAECKCPKGTIDDHGKCTGRTECNPTELQECRDMGRECVYKEHKAQCVCPKGMVEVGDRCSVLPRTCTQEENEECEKKGEKCVIENEEVACKMKEASVSPTGASPAPVTCTEEKKRECDRKGEECIVEDDKTVCKKRGDPTATTKASPGAETITTTEASQDPQGSGSGTNFVSAVLVLCLLIAALPVPL